MRHLPLDAIVYLLGRLGWVEDSRLAVNLASGLSAATHASFGAWAAAPFPRKGAPPGGGKSQLGSGLNQRDEATHGFLTRQMPAFPRQTKKSTGGV